MDYIDYQSFDDFGGRRDASESRTDAAENRKDAADRRKDALRSIQIAQININKLYVSAEEKGYNNGSFLPTFQEAMTGIARQALNAGTLRVLMYCIGQVDENNMITGNLYEIAERIGVSDDTVRRAIKDLVRMQILCIRTDCGARGQQLYDLTNKMLNPRIGIKHNTRQIHIEAMPPLLALDGARPLLPSAFDQTDWK